MLGNSEVQRVRPVGIDPRAVGSYSTKTEQREDHGPYYLFSPGEPIHRVDCRDSVPHIYPFLIQPCTTWAHWLPNHLTSERFTMQAQDTAGNPVFANPIYAGVTKNQICDAPNNYAHLGVVNLQAFEKIDAEELQLDRFNSLILPEPVFYGNDDLPPQHKNWFLERRAVISEEMQKVGGLGTRINFLKSFSQDLSAGQVDVPAHLKSVYLQAVNEMPAACSKFQAFAEAYLRESDRQVKDRDKSGIGTYDERDARLQWLLARKGVDVAEAQVIQVAQSPQTDVGAVVAAVMAAMSQHREAQAETATPKPKTRKPAEVQDDPTF